MKQTISIGHKQFKLTVIGSLPPDKHGARWFCRCECGVEKSIAEHNLTAVRPQKSCGCSKGQFVTESKTRHGMAESNEYNIWCAMKRRCLNPKCDKFADYGGRGIQVCERWLHSFENFYADMGPRPSRKHSVDRYPDVNGNYEPSNCRWTVHREQMRNTRRNRIVIVDGVPMCVKAASEKIGVPHWRLTSRLNMGMTDQQAIESAINFPNLHRHRKRRSVTQS